MTIFTKNETVFSTNRKFSFHNIVLSLKKLLFFVLCFWFVENYAFSQAIKKYQTTLAKAESLKFTNISKADSMQEILVSLSKNLPDSLHVKTLIYCAEMNEILGKQAAYFRDVISLQQYVNTTENEKTKLKIYQLLADFHSKQNEFNEATFYLQNAITYNKKRRDINDWSIIYNAMAFNFMRQNAKDSSLYYIQKSIQFAKRGSIKKTYIKSIQSQALIYQYFGQLELSFAKNTYAIQLAISNNEKFLLANLFREIGLSQLQINNTKDAEKYFEQSLEYAKKVNDPKQIALAYSNMAMVQFTKKELNKALNLNNKALVIMEKIQSENGLGVLYNHQGMIYRELKNYELAQSNFNKALVLFESAGNKSKIAEVYFNVGTIFLKQKKHENALNYLFKTIKIGKQIGASHLVYKSYKTISDVYGELNNKDLALSYLEKYMNFVDSNTMIQSSIKIAELNEQYQSEQRDQLINQQANAIDLQNKNSALTKSKLENITLKNNNKLIIIFLILLIVLIFAIIIFSRWNRNKITQMQREAEMSQTLLRTQMNPHFVFNAMSVIQSYIYENDTKNSTKFLVNFSKLMRLILENSSKESISIETEIEILQKYLETQKLRFEDRFNFNISFDESLLESKTMLPPMITQPFVENAIEHGQLHTFPDGMVKISFNKIDQMLQIVVEDNGVGREEAGQSKKSKDHKSMAMKITQDRIENLNYKYKSNGKITFIDLKKNLKRGTKVIISVPYWSE